MSKDLSVGFTGIPREPATGVRKVAKNAVDTVRRETSAVAAGAADHPHGNWAPARRRSIGVYGGLRLRPRGCGSHLHLAIAGRLATACSNMADVPG